jgi:hypothetical protein
MLKKHGVVVESWIIIIGKLTENCCWTSGTSLHRLQCPNRQRHCLLRPRPTAHSNTDTLLPRWPGSWRRQWKQAGHCSMSHLKVETSHASHETRWWDEYLWEQSNGHVALMEYSRKTSVWWNAFRKTSVLWKTLGRRRCDGMPLERRQYYERL